MIIDVWCGHTDEALCNAGIPLFLPQGTLVWAPLASLHGCGTAGAATDDLRTFPSSLMDPLNLI